jgi:hypothetical protein
VNDDRFKAAAYATGASTASAGPALTVRHVVDTIRAIKASIKENPEPIGEWMRGQGFPPETCCLILPPGMRAQLGPFWPPYVTFSPLVTSPTLARFNPQQWLQAARSSV